MASGPQARPTEAWGTDADAKAGLESPLLRDPCHPKREVMAEATQSRGQAEGWRAEGWPSPRQDPTTGGE